MAYTCHHLDKFVFANIDLAEEQLETKKKALIILAGASSSGKSFLSHSLKHALETNGHRCLIISLDQYNVGLSGIIPNKVNLHRFDNQLPNLKEIKEKIHDIIVDIPFEQKYGEEAIGKIKEAVSPLIASEDLADFLDGLKEEWGHLNFDEPTVYDLKEAGQDIQSLFKEEKVKAKSYSKIVSERIPSQEIWDGKDYDVLIVEGIYALNHVFLDELKGINPVKNYIEGNPKTLFLRRIVRDKQTTSASSAFTVKLYFNYIMDSYRETILPTRDAANIIFVNDFSFGELRTGEMFTSRDTLPIQNEGAAEELKKRSHILNVSYQKDYYFSVPDEKLENQNLLRFRELSFDGGKTFVPGSLVHKGAPKFRSDNKIIRPINILLDEEEIKEVWKTNDEAIFTFLDHGFMISGAEQKIKTRFVYQGQVFTLYDVKGKQSYLEITGCTNEAVLEEIRSLILKNNA